MDKIPPPPGSSLPPNDWDAHAKATDEIIRWAYWAYPDDKPIYLRRTVLTASLARRGEEHLLHSEQRWAQRVYVVEPPGLYGPKEREYRGFIHLRPVDSSDALLCEAYLARPHRLRHQVFPSASSRFLEIHGEPCCPSAEVTCYASPPTSQLDLATCGQYSIFMAMMTAAVCFPTVYGASHAGAISPFEVTCVAFPDDNKTLVPAGEIAMSPAMVADVAKSDYVRLGCVEDRRTYHGSPEVLVDSVTEGIIAYLDLSLPVIVYNDPDSLSSNAPLDWNSLDDATDDGHSVLVVGYGKENDCDWFYYHDPLRAPYMDASAEQLVYSALKVPTEPIEGRKDDPSRRDVVISVIVPSGVGVPLSAVFVASRNEMNARKLSPDSQTDPVWMAPNGAIYRWRLIRRNRFVEDYAPSVGIPKAQADEVVAHIGGSTEWVWTQEYYADADAIPLGLARAVWVFYAGTQPDMRDYPFAAAWDEGELWLRAWRHEKWLRK